jgi:hypothetical protein
MPVNTLWTNPTPRSIGIPTNRFVVPLVRINGHTMDMHPGQKIDEAFLPESANGVGPMGPQGIQGIQGIPGIQGPQGIPGVSAPDYIPQAMLAWGSRIATLPSNTNNNFPPITNEEFAVLEDFKRTNGREFVFNFGGIDSRFLFLKLLPTPEAIGFDSQKYRIFEKRTQLGYTTDGLEAPIWTGLNVTFQTENTEVIVEITAAIAINQFIRFELVELDSPNGSTGKSIGFVTLSVRMLDNFSALIKQFPFVSQAPSAIDLTPDAPLVPLIRLINPWTQTSINAVMYEPLTVEVTNFPQSVFPSDVYVFIEHLETGNFGVFYGVPITQNGTYSLTYSGSPAPLDVTAGAGQLTAVLENLSTQVRYGTSQNYPIEFVPL